MADFNTISEKVITNRLDLEQFLGEIELLEDYELIEKKMVLDFKWGTKKFLDFNLFQENINIMSKDLLDAKIGFNHTPEHGYVELTVIGIRECSGFKLRFT